MVRLCVAYEPSSPNASGPVFSSAHRVKEVSKMPTENMAPWDEECYGWFGKNGFVAFAIRYLNYVVGYFEGQGNEPWSVKKLLSLLNRPKSVRVIAWSVRPKFLFVGQDGIHFFNSNYSPIFLSFHTCFIIIEPILLEHFYSVVWQQ